MVHKTLDRQLNKFSGSTDHPTTDWAGFLAAVNDTYVHYDEDHALIERSLDISSREHDEYTHKLKKAAADLEESGKRFKTLVEGSWDVTELIDNTGKITYVTPSITRVLGFTPEEYIGKEASSFVHPDDLDMMTKAFGPLMASPGTTLTNIARGRHADGSWRWLESTTTNRLEDPSVHSLVLNFRDITKQKEAEEAMSASQAQFLAFMEHNPSLAWIKDSQGKYTYINPTFENRFQTTVSAIQGKTDADFFPKEVAERLRKNDQDALELDKLIETQETVPTPDGVPHVWLVYKFPFIDQQKQRMVGGMAIDITERKTFEESLQAKTRDLELLNKTMVGRELNMIELKEKIKQLESRLAIGL